MSIADDRPDLASRTRAIAPPENRHLNNKLHRLALVSPAKLASVEAFVDNALCESIIAAPKAVKP